MIYNSEKLNFSKDNLYTMEMTGYIYLFAGSIFWILGFIEYKKNTKSIK